jgi:phosphoadenosine phosphosulfate reductase
MGEVLSLELEQKAIAVRDLLSGTVQSYGKVVYSNSLGAEAMVLTDIIWNHVPQVDMFSIDTGRLHQETYDLLEKLELRYKRRIRLVYPDSRSLEQLVAANGVNGFYHSLEARVSCCGVRKIEPFKRAIAGYSAWVTGVRREQSEARARGQALEWDAQYCLHKVSPLLDWTEEQIWQYIRARQLPYNSLHNRSYPSIGCQPCTRAIQPGESRRAGRWWWEQPESRECGLQARVLQAVGQT